MDFSQNYFELFQIERCFRANGAQLADRYRQLQRELHPDNFAGKSPAEQRLAVQWTSQVNNAYQTLKSPLLCAEYLLELIGHPVNSDSLTICDGAFLFKQMEWRESLADLSQQETLSDQATQALEALTLEVSQDREQLLTAFEQMFSDQRYDDAKQVVAKLHFVEKMLVEIDQVEDRFLLC